MISSELMAKRSSALFARIVEDKISEKKYSSFESFFFDVFRPLKLNDSYYRKRFVKTTGLQKAIESISSNRFVLLEAFRGFAKTDLALGRAVHLGISTHEDVIIFTETGNSAKERIERLTSFVKNSPFLKRYVPVVKEGIKWNANEITFVDNDNPIVVEELDDNMKLVNKYKPRKIFSISCVGISSGFRGLRANHIIFDDVVTERTSSTLEGIALLEETIVTKAFPLSNQKGGTILFIGTPQNKRDFIHKLRRKQLFKKVFIPIKNAKGEMNNLPLEGEIEKALKYTNKPFIQDKEWFDEQVQKMSDSGSESHPYIQKEYFLNIVNSQASVFTDGIISRCKSENLSMGFYPKRDNCYRIMGIDPNGTLNAEEARVNNKDYAAILIADYNYVTNEIFLLEVGRTHDINKWEEMIFSMFSRLDCDYIAYEGYGFSNVMQDKILSSYGKYNAISSNKDDILIDSKSSTSKENAILNLLSYFSEGKVYMPYSSDNDKKKADTLIEELQSVGGRNSIHDDLADCLVRVQLAAIKLKKDTNQIKPLDDEFMNFLSGKKPQNKNVSEVKTKESRFI